ncbi:6-phosphogluconolactonase, partial [Bacteroides sp.]
PYNKRKRIAMTGCLMFAARKIIFLVIGRDKANVVYDMLHSGDTGPAAYVAHHAECVELFTDEQAYFR